MANWVYELPFGATYRDLAPHRYTMQTMARQPRMSESAQVSQAHLLLHDPECRDSLLLDGCCCRSSDREELAEPWLVTPLRPKMRIGQLGD